MKDFPLNESTYYDEDGILEYNKDFEELTPNRFNHSFSKAKKLLEEDVYNGVNIAMRTIYSDCGYFYNGVNYDDCDYVNDGRFSKRSKKIEWEHIVPASNFGSHFDEWNKGHPDCIDSKGKTFKGRKCAGKINMEYKFMEADMYNLKPAIGSINAKRSNYPFAIIEGEERLFGPHMDLEIVDGEIEPKDDIRGDIARTYMYMSHVYSGKVHLTSEEERMFEDWDLYDPISEQECRRYFTIKKLQGNINPILDDECHELLRKDEEK